MIRLNVFDDDRKTPKLSVNIKVKIKSNDQEELSAWNGFFGYLMKKPRTKLDFLSVSPIRELPISKITLENIKNYITEDDYKYLYPIEDIFNNRLTTDVKAFVLAILRISIDDIRSLIQ